VTDLVAAADELLEPTTGELLPATPENAARIRQRCAEAIRSLREYQAACDAVLVEESRRLGTKTVHLDGATVTVTGGPGVEYDVTELRAGLSAADCPEGRIDAAIVAEVSYRVNRSVLRQLAAANREYAEAIDRAKVTVEKPYRASVKGDA
jgi:hypothetical protein